MSDHDVPVAALQRLSALAPSLRLRPAWLAEQLAAEPSLADPAAPSGAAAAASLLLQRLAAADLREASEGSLPAGLDRQHNICVEGAHLVQLLQIVDISRPRGDDEHEALEDGAGGGVPEGLAALGAAGGASRGGGRKGIGMLKVCLSDGAQTIVGIERRPIAALRRATPGTKAVLGNRPLLRRGLLLLEPQHLEFLGTPPPPSVVPSSSSTAPAPAPLPAPLPRVAGVAIPPIGDAGVPCAGRGAGMPAGSSHIGAGLGVPVVAGFGSSAEIAVGNVAVLAAVGGASVHAPSQRSQSSVVVGSLGSVGSSSAIIPRSAAGRVAGRKRRVGGIAASSAISAPAAAASRRPIGLDAGNAPPFGGMPSVPAARGIAVADVADVHMSPRIPAPVDGAAIVPQAPLVLNLLEEPPPSVGLRNSATVVGRAPVHVSATSAAATNLLRDPMEVDSVQIRVSGPTRTASAGVQSHAVAWAEVAPPQPSTSSIGRVEEAEARTRCYVCDARVGHHGIEVSLCDGQALCSALLPLTLVRQLFGSGAQDALLAQVLMLHGFFGLKEDVEYGSGLALVTHFSHGPSKRDLESKLTELVGDEQ
mmetsp:Transcript_23789/g.66455  ORF Transcript_23789/g.66455 Transcript_23789/m.66455 type:complete len:591 (+) Transcript_23789:82-1854(+)